MSVRPSEIAPSTLAVELTEDGIAVEYLDGRTVFYHGVPATAEGSLTTTPGKDTHVLVTDGSETEGVLTYVNDRKTDGDILESSGVGRVLLEKGETTSLYPGVRVTRTGFRYEIEVDFDAVDGRVFVFEEDEMGELSREIVSE
jgi:hypothetical protein